MMYSSFVLKSRVYISRLLIIMTSLMACSVLASQHSLLQKVNVHGFVSQGIIQANNSNFVNDDGELSTELTEVGLNLSYQISDDFRFTGQAVYLNGGNRYQEGVRIDYALLDWSVLNSENWKVNAYLGRFKNYHWLYSSVRNVPMSRPTIVLPQSVYFDGTRDMSVGGDGLAISAKYNSDVLGDIDFNISSGTSPLSSEQTQVVMGDFAQGKIKHSTDLQTSLYWQPFLSAWRFGIAYTGADFDYHRKDNAPLTGEPLDGKLKLERFYLNALYQAELWSVSAELIQESMVIEGLFPLPIPKKVGQGGYVQGQYYLQPDLQLLVRYERFYADKDDKSGQSLEATSSELLPYTVPSYFGYQHDTVLGLSYDISDSLKLQIEHHWYQGTARLTPLITPDTNINSDKYWQLSAAQLTYWF